MAREQRVGGDAHEAARASTRTLAVTEREVACLNSDRPVRTATNRCFPTRLMRASAPTSARSAPRVSITSWRTSARTAVADLFPDQSGPRRTGKVTTSLARTQRVPRSSTGRLISQFMRASQPQSKPYRLTNDRGAKMTANKRIEADLKLPPN